MVITTTATSSGSNKPQQQATHSIAELITDFHKTTGDIPPPLIGTTATLVEQHIYVFGGRFQATRQLSNKVYVLDLMTKTWKHVQPQNKPPAPRYFHSANRHNDHHIIFFGGMGMVKERKRQAFTDPVREVQTTTALNDIVFLNLKNMSWEYPNLLHQTLPTPRYAHLSTLINHQLTILGGQNAQNQYVEDIFIFDIKRKEWCSSPISTQQHQYGSYRSAAVAVSPAEFTPPSAPALDLVQQCSPLAMELEDEEDALQLSKDTVSPNEFYIHVYSNIHKAMNPLVAAQQQQTLPTQQQQHQHQRTFHTWKFDNDQLVEVQDLTESTIRAGTTIPSPPPLKFPLAFLLGQHFILAGPHITPTYQQFQIWALDMTTFQWTKIEAGQLLARGSWLRGLLCDQFNKFIVFGHPERSMQEDYKDRVQNFSHFACVDMEIFGIYKPPPPTFSGLAQGLGLALLKDPVFADLKMTTTDQKHILVNSAVLAQRWPSVHKYLEPLLSPRVETVDLKLLDMEKRELLFPDTYVVLVAFLQFIYTDHLVTAQQHQPQILTRLLFISNLFDIPRLKALATHALHQMLNIQTAAMIYESAALSDTVSLQIRALRVMINAKKMMQRQKLIERQNQQHMLSNTNSQDQQQTNNNEAVVTPTTMTLSHAANNTNSILPTPSSSNRLIQDLKLASSISTSRENTRPNTPIVSNIQSQPQQLSTAPINSTLPQQSSLSTGPQQQVVPSNTHTATATKGTNNATIKLPNFRMKQLSAAQQVALQYSSRSSSFEHYQNSDFSKQPSPLSSASPSPRVTPSNSTSYFSSSNFGNNNHQQHPSSYTMPLANSTTAASQARSHVSSFWRQATTSISGTTLKKSYH